MPVSIHGLLSLLLGLLFLLPVHVTEISTVIWFPCLSYFTLDWSYPSIFFSVLFLQTSLISQIYPAQEHLIFHLVHLLQMCLQAQQLDAPFSAAMSSGPSHCAWTLQNISSHVYHPFTLKKGKIFHLKMSKKQLLATWWSSLMAFQRH